MYSTKQNLQITRNIFHCLKFVDWFSVFFRVKFKKDNIEIFPDKKGNGNCLYKKNKIIAVEWHFVFFFILKEKIKKKKMIHGDRYFIRCTILVQIQGTYGAFIWLWAINHWDIVKLLVVKQRIPVQSEVYSILPGKKVTKPIESNASCMRIYGQLFPQHNVYMSSSSRLKACQIFDQSSSIPIQTRFKYLSSDEIKDKTNNAVACKIDSWLKAQTSAR